MSKSFDDKMRERLGDFSYPPPEDAKEMILGQVSSPSNGLFYVYQSLSVLLFLVALFKIGSNSNPIEVIEVSQQTQEAPSHYTAPSPYIEKPKREYVVKNSEEKESDLTVASYYQKNDPVVETENSATEDLVFTAEEREFNSRRFEYSTFALDELERAVYPLALNRKMIKRRIVPEKRKWASPYYNAGAFFIYNRLRPNLNDDIYVGEYDAPFSLSGSRLGMVMEFGLHKQWSGIFASRIGLSVNNYSQNYSFTVRSTRPDSVSVTGQDGFLEPHFDTENIQMKKRVTLVGVKAQGFWYVFQNTSNVLFASVEYQKLLGKGPQFTYQSENHSLMKSSQYLMEIGLRKNIFKFNSGHLYAMPGIRYALNKFGDENILSVKPFSVGITISYGLK